MKKPNLVVATFILISVLLVLLLLLYCPLPSPQPNFYFILVSEPRQQPLALRLPTEELPGLRSPEEHVDESLLHSVLGPRQAGRQAMD